MAYRTRRRTTTRRRSTGAPRRRTAATRRTRATSSRRVQTLRIVVEAPRQGGTIDGVPTIAAARPNAARF